MVARSSRVARSTPGIPPLAVGCVFVRGLLSHGEDESHLATKNCTLPIGLFNALVIFAREGERQRGLRGNSPLCSGNGAIVQLTYYAGSDAGRRPALPGVHTRLLRVRGGARVYRFASLETISPNPLRATPPDRSLVFPSTPLACRDEECGRSCAGSDAGRRPALPGVPPHSCLSLYR